MQAWKELGHSCLPVLGEFSLTQTRKYHVTFHACVHGVAEFKHDKSERENIGAVVVVGSIDLFRTGIRPRSHSSSIVTSYLAVCFVDVEIIQTTTAVGRIHVIRGTFATQAKVSYLHNSRFIHETIVGFQIAMNQIAGMDILHALCHLMKQSQRIWNVNAMVVIAAALAVLQCFASLRISQKVSQCAVTTELHLDVQNVSHFGSFCYLLLFSRNVHRQFANIVSRRRGRGGRKFAAHLWMKGNGLWRVIHCFHCSCRIVVVGCILTIKVKAIIFQRFNRSQVPTKGERL
mmetsp:Transcript_23245/g.38523  ORF Transcript_23245/g.38523 Transcript_23245/m.38523 type:complete len:289 (-) Transcript_23245:2733-3599(-)